MAPPCGKKFCPRYAGDPLCEKCAADEIERLRAERDDLAMRALTLDQALTNAVQMKNAAYERCARVAEEHGEPYALNTNTGAMMFRAVTEKIAAKIRALEQKGP